MIVMLTISGFAKQGWLYPPGPTVVWKKPTVLNPGGYNPNFTEEALNAANWYTVEAPDCDFWNMYIDYENRVIYEIFEETTNTVVIIDNDTYTIGLQFAHILTGYFGEDAPINRNITEKYIMEFFAAKVAVGTISALELAHANLLERYFTILKDSPYNPTPNTTWDFPFGQTSITKDIIRRYYIKDGENVYID